MSKTNKKVAQKPYITFEEHFSSVLKDLFHKSSKNRLICHEELPVIDFKYIKNFFKTLVDKDQLASALYVLELSDLKLFNKKDLALLDTNQLKLIDMKKMVFFFMYLGVVGFLMFLSLGILSFFVAGYEASEIAHSRGDVLTYSRVADLSSDKDVTYLSYVDTSYLAGQTYMDSVESDVQVTQPRSAFIQTVIAAEEDSIYSSCSFETYTGVLYTSNSSASQSSIEGGLCVSSAVKSGSDLSGYTWKFISNEGVMASVATTNDCINLHDYVDINDLVSVEVVSVSSSVSNPSVCSLGIN